MVRVLDRLGSALARLRVSQQLGLLGIVLLIPAVIAGRAYHQAQSSQIAFSAQEQVGVRALGPANDLVIAAVRARSAAIGAALHTEEVSSTTQQTTASGHEIAVAAQGLAGIAAELDELVGRFTVTGV
ncbi:MAG: hypothetical protein QOK49_1614 [Baekduia sp.]|jgi:hypothetical protein|nr:hypothetical protein [Baekduia sp.]